MDNTKNPQLSRLLDLCGLNRTFVRGSGVWLTDADGRRFLDAYAQFGAVALGHNAPAVTDAVRAALDSDLPAMFQPHRAENAEALAAELRAAAPGDLEHCVFTTSGAEAVEAAIKAVRAASGRNTILSADHGFHGKTLGALSLTGRARHAAGFGMLAPGFERIPFGDAEALERRLARADEPVAAFVVEPIQGEGGVRVPPAGYLARAKELCARAGAALVVDEIQTGLGRTGRLFACEEEGVVPDILLIAKALGGGLFPLGAALISGAWWSERFAFAHSSTFANNNVACAVGRAVLRALREPGFLDGVAARGQRLRVGLARLAARYPGVIADVRGRGLLAGIELRSPGDQRGLLPGYLQHQGLYAYAVAGTLAETASILVLPTLGTDNVIRVAPPLVVTDEQIDLVVDGLESICAQLQRNPAEAITRGLGWLAPPRQPAHAESVVLPAPEPRPAPPAGAPERRRWAFMIHYTRPEDVGITDPGLARLSTDERAAYLQHVNALPAGVCLEAPVVRSPATGVEVEGLVLALPLLPETMLRRGRRAVAGEIARGVDRAAALGAHVVGLGGFTTPMSARGTAVLGRGVHITTGNALTAGVAFRAVCAEAERLGIDIGRASIAVLGARGSVGALLARAFARERPGRLVLLGNPQGDAGQLDALAVELSRVAAGIESSRDPSVLRQCQIVVSASGAAASILRADAVSPGTLLCDVARPADVSPELAARRDVVVIEGGLVALPDARLSFGRGNLQDLPDGIQLACLSETILHALEGTPTNFGVGDNVPLLEADWALTLADRHGFRTAWRRHGEIHVVPPLVVPQRRASAGGPGFGGAS